jgi:hypothetical protein
MELGRSKKLQLRLLLSIVDKVVVLLLVVLLLVEILVLLVVLLLLVLLLVDMGILDMVLLHMVHMGMVDVHSLLRNLLYNLHILLFFLHNHQSGR